MRGPSPPSFLHFVVILKQVRDEEKQEGGSRSMACPTGKLDGDIRSGAKTTFLHPPTHALSYPVSTPDNSSLRAPGEGDDTRLARGFEHF